MTIQFITHLLGETSNVMIPLPSLLVLLFVLTLATFLSCYKLAVASTYLFLANWVFLENAGKYTSIELESVIVVGSFLIFGGILALTIYHHGFSH